MREVAIGDVRLLFGRRNAIIMGVTMRMPSETFDDRPTTRILGTKKVSSMRKLWRHLGYDCLSQVFNERNPIKMIGPFAFCL